MKYSAADQAYINDYITSWEEKEKWEHGVILATLKRIRKKQPHVFPELVKRALEFDKVGVALCAYTYLSWEEDKELLEYIQQAVEKEIPAFLDEFKKLQEEEIAEADRVNEELGEDANGKERAKVWKKYAYDVYQRRMELAKRVGVLWQTLILLWRDENKEQLEEEIQGLMEAYLESVTHLYVKVKFNLERDFPDFLIEPLVDHGFGYPKYDIYIRTMYFVKRCYDIAIHEGKEVHYDLRLEMNKINDFTKIILRKYVNDLFREKKYRALSSFLHKTMRNDYEDLYQMSGEEFWDKLMTSQSERIAECYLRLNNLKENAQTIDAWYQWVEERVDEGPCLAWCQWARYLFDLEILLTGDITEEEFHEEATSRMPEVNYPYEETQDLKRIVEASWFIYSEMFRRKWDILFIIRLLGNNSPFAYDRKTIYFASPISWENQERYHDWELNLANFYAQEMSAEERVFIFMNTPLRYAVEFRDFVIEMGKRFGTGRIGEFFHEYEIHGRLIEVDYEARARGRMKFQLDQKYIFSKYLIDNEGQKGRVFYNRVLHVHEDYYEDNEERLKKIKKDSYCSFRLCGYAKNGANDGILLVDDVQGGVEKEINEREEMQKILDWMKQMQEEGQFIPTGKAQFKYVYYPSKLGLNHAFATEILKTAMALRKNPGHTRRFLGQINSGVMDKISLFQYLPDKKSSDSFRVEGDFNTFRNTVILPLANELCADPDITKMDKANIYMNTCLKAFFSFSEFWYKAKLNYEDMVSYRQFNNYYNKFLFYVRFVRQDEEGQVFALGEEVQIRQGYSGEAYRWIYDGETLPENNGHLYYRVTVDRIDRYNKIVWVHDVYPEKIVDPWKKFVHGLLDLKNDASVTHIKNIKKHNNKYRLNYFDRRRIVQLATQYSSHFMLVGKKEYPKEYNLTWCRRILTVLGDDNPFADKERVLAEQPFEEYESEKMIAAFYKFTEGQFALLQEAPNAFSPEEFLDFFYQSPYNLVIDEKEFFELVLPVFKLEKEELLRRYEEYRKENMIL